MRAWFTQCEMQYNGTNRLGHIESFIGRQRRNLTVTLTLKHRLYRADQRDFLAHIDDAETPEGALRRFEDPTRSVSVSPKDTVQLKPRPVPQPIFASEDALASRHGRVTLAVYETASSDCAPRGDK
jgi:hypothetical protein